jgi:hypothetical protein
MATFGAAVGMVVGLALLAVSLWEMPRLRRAFFSDWNSISGFIAVSALLGGWAGYWIFTKLFQG